MEISRSPAWFIYRRPTEAKSSDPFIPKRAASHQQSPFRRVHDIKVGLKAQIPWARSKLPENSHF